MSQPYYGGDFHDERCTIDESAQPSQDSHQSYARPALLDSQYPYNDASSMHRFGPASIHSSSPVSLTFSSDGVSQGNQPSYLNTPSNSNADLPRYGAGGLSEQVKPTNNVSRGSKVKAWVHMNAANHSGKRDKNWRKCYRCTVRKQMCQDGPDPTRCLSCKDSLCYCKGPISTPLFIEIDTLKAIAARAFELMGNKLDLPMSDVWPHETHHLEPQAVMKRSLPIQSPPSLPDFPYMSELPAASEIFDTLLAYGEVSHRPMKVDDVDLTTFENLCRRFCACLALLRNLHTCRIDATKQSYRQVHHQALGFYLRLSFLTNDLLKEIFDEIRVHCGASRRTNQTPKIMGNLAFFLGQMFAETRYLREYAQSFPHLLFLQIFAQDSATETALIFYGKSFNDDKFTTGSKSDSCCLPGIHLQTSGTFSFGQQGVVEICSTTCPSVFEILSSDFLSDAIRNGLLDASKIEAIVSTIQKDVDTGISNADDAYLDSFRAVRRGILVSQVPVSHTTALKAVEDEAFQLRSDIDSLLKIVLDKTKALRALTMLPTSNENLDEKPFDNQSSLCETIKKGHNETKGLAPASPNLETALAEFNKFDFDGALAMAQQQFPPSSMTETGSDTAMQDVIDPNESKEQRKRKRVSPATVARNSLVGVQSKYGATNVAVDEKASKNASTNDVELPYAKLQKRTTSTATQLKKHFSRALHDQGQQHGGKQIPRTESGDPVGNEELELQDAPRNGHRPKTWPLRQALRQSVEISVKTLVKGFEKLRA